MDPAQLPLDMGGELSRRALGRFSVAPWDRAKINGLGLDKHSGVGRHPTRYETDDDNDYDDDDDADEHLFNVIWG